MYYRDAQPHWAELRSRTLKAFWGLLIAWIASLVFAPRLWDIISQPGISFQKHLNVAAPKIFDVIPMQHISVIWVQLPLFCAFLVAWPWIVYQLWACIAAGLSKRDRRSAIP